MTVDELFWLIMALVISLVLGNTSIDHIVPHNKRFKFNQICNDYQQKAIQNGYLTQAEVDSFTSELQAKGIEISAISVPTVKLEWGAEFSFDVQAVYTQRELQMNFSKLERQYNLSYKHKAKAMCDE